MNYGHILIETQDRVGVITLNRPKALNSINADLIRELIDAVVGFDEDDSIGCIVIKGSERAFAAGADISDVQRNSYSDMERLAPFSVWDRLTEVRKPIVAAVSGFALGGGCELAMMCDIIIASDTAKFGQPEIKLGVIPGVGGTQRLTRAVGKAKAMELCLTGRMLDAVDALMFGLVARIVPQDQLEEAALALATEIAAMSLSSVIMAKECINRSFEVPLSEGVKYERRTFHALFATDDQKEGMAAFLEKRTPRFANK